MLSQFPLRCIQSRLRAFAEKRERSRNVLGNTYPEVEMASEPVRGLDVTAIRCALIPLDGPLLYFRRALFAKLPNIELGLGITRFCMWKQEPIRGLVMTQRFLLNSSR